MIYTNLTRKALKISFEAHKNQTDKSGTPYIYHPYELASHMDDEYSVCVALLHDVVEDTDITLTDLENAGFPSEITEAIRIMTHNKSVSYLDYVKIVKTNNLARKVKIADLMHNLDSSRFEEESTKHKEKTCIYRQALSLLQ